MTDHQQKIIDAFVALTHNLIDHDLIKDPDGDHMQEIEEALALTHPQQEAPVVYDKYKVSCPVCRYKTTVHHNTWASLACGRGDCKAVIINPYPNPDNELNRVERAKTDAHNATLTLRRAERILGKHHSPV
jgi:2-phospho-L-lactate transferase/gluconeogenesis factor (CofD/UPF0052 family)